MKKIILSLIAILFLITSTLADTYVRGYYKSNGTYVQPHYRSSPNSTTSDNWSTYGNTNPYTGERGTRRSCGSSLLNC
jgi:uncharacterized protein YxeA